MGQCHCWKIPMEEAALSVSALVQLPSTAVGAQWVSNDPEDGWISSLVFPFSHECLKFTSSFRLKWHLFPIFSYHSGMNSWTKLETISFFLTIKVSFLSFHTIFSGISLISSIHHWILRHLRPPLESPGLKFCMVWYHKYRHHDIYISNDIHIMLDIHRHSIIINHYYRRVFLNDIWHFVGFWRWFLTPKMWGYMMTTWIPLEWWWLPIRIG